MKTVFESHN